MLISRTDRGLLANWWFTVDRPLITAVLMLMAAGVLFSMAASPPVAERLGLQNFHFFERQLLFLAPGVLILFATSILNPDQARRFSLWTLAACFVLMLVALKYGPEIKGAHRWIDIGSFNLQPSEFAKPAFVVVTAWLLSEGVRRGSFLWKLGSWAVFGSFLALLALQPDFGQAVLVCGVWGVMLLIYGVPWTLMFGLAGVALAGAYGAYATLPHVASRVNRFLDPDKGDTFQVDTALKALENGGAFGTGPGGGSAKHILPDAHTDFIFAVIGEEYGFVACLVLIALFFFIVTRVLNRARNESNPMVVLALTGLSAIFALQAMINMAVNVSLLPAKGMTLPFISYGGSSLLATAFAMGLILAFARRRPRASMPTGAFPGLAAAE
ncbi:MAG: putative lipid II flippase FtsW [Parvibaculaceae bacterium]